MLAEDVLVKKALLFLGGPLVENGLVCHRDATGNIKAHTVVRTPEYGMWHL
jgi:hypothetical protein